MKPSKMGLREAIRKSKEIVETLQAMQKQVKENEELSDSLAAGIWNLDMDEMPKDHSKIILWYRINEIEYQDIYEGKFIWCKLNIQDTMIFIAWAKLNIPEREKQSE